MSALVVNCKGRKIGSAIESEIKLRDLSSGQTFKVEETSFPFNFSLHIIAIANAMEKGKIGNVNLITIVVINFSIFERK